MSDEKKPLVIYHDGCWDGIAGAWAFYHMYGDKFEYHGGSYNSPPPDFFGRDVYLVDFSYPADVVSVMLEYSSKVVLLDHHDTALRNLEPLFGREKFVTSYATRSKSGAMIAWEYVTDGAPAPELLLHVQDRDLWKFERKNTETVMRACMSYPRTIETFDSLVFMPIGELVVEGELLLRQFKQDLHSILRNVRMININGESIPVVNANGMYASEAGNRMCELDVPYSISYYVSGNGAKISLRSKEGGADVNKTVLMFDPKGGGHPRAAGGYIEFNNPLWKMIHESDKSSPDDML